MKQLATAFNAGFTIAEHTPWLAQLISSIRSLKSAYLLALQAGIREYERESKRKKDYSQLQDLRSHTAHDRDIDRGI